MRRVMWGLNEAGEVVFDPGVPQRGRPRWPFVKDLALLPYRPEEVAGFFRRHFSRPDLRFRHPAIAWDDPRFWEAAELAWFWYWYVNPGRARGGGTGGPELPAGRPPPPAWWRPPPVTVRDRRQARRALRELVGQRLAELLDLPSVWGELTYLVIVDLEGGPDRPSAGFDRALEALRAIAPYSPVPEAGGLEPAVALVGRGGGFEVRPALVRPGEAGYLRRQVVWDADLVGFVELYSDPATAVVWRLAEEIRRAEVAEKRSCPACDREFEPARQDQRYCSTRCRQRAWRRRVGPGPGGAAAPPAAGSAGVAAVGVFEGD